MNKQDTDYQEKYNQLPIIRFYQYKSNPGIVAIYEYGGKEVATIQLVAD